MENREGKRATEGGCEYGQRKRGGNTNTVRRSPGEKKKKGEEKIIVRVKGGGCEGVERV